MDEPLHFECELGDVHFAIHADQQAASAVRNGISFALAVKSLERTLLVLRSLNCKILCEPTVRGFATMTAIEDPDGNYVEITQLSARWLSYLASRPKLARDVVTWYDESADSSESSSKEETQ